MTEGTSVCNSVAQCRNPGYVHKISGTLILIRTPTLSHAWHEVLCPQEMPSPRARLPLRSLLQLVRAIVSVYILPPRFISCIDVAAIPAQHHLCSSIHHPLSSLFIARDFLEGSTCH